jgi:pilus assembly protein TadC
MSKLFCLILWSLFPFQASAHGITDKGAVTLLEVIAVITVAFVILNTERSSWRGLQLIAALIGMWFLMLVVYTVVGGSFIGDRIVDDYVGDFLTCAVAIFFVFKLKRSNWRRKDIESKEES